MNSWEAFYGPNVGYALELYERYLSDPNAVDEETRALFDQIGKRDGSTVGMPGAEAVLARPVTRTRLEHPNGHSRTPTRLDRQGAVTRSPQEVAGASSAVATSSPPWVGPGDRNGIAEPVHPELPAAGTEFPGRAAGAVPSDAEIARIVAAARLARSIREYGHLDATIDPLGGPRPGDPMLDPHTHGISDADLRQLPPSIVWPSAGPEMGTCLDAIKRLRAIYSGSIGYEFDHVEDFGERTWLHSVVESGVYRTPLAAEQRRALLVRLTEVDGFERFLHTVFQGQKRFSIEGNDALIPMLDQVLSDAHESGIGEVTIGMAHRGRLNVLAHILGKPYAAIFAEFQTAGKRDASLPIADQTATQAGGDVKYHLGAHRTVEDGPLAGLAITMADNPSHLEFVNPVIQGFARASQDERDRPGAPIQHVDRAMAITIHGDASFPGEGVVAETLNLSALPGYRTGGSIHIIVNNQVGFTTGADAGRSTLYASDLAKGFEVPIVHVNADDPEACLAAARLADAYRQRFHKDFLIDLVGYRRWGHNEGDEPSFTQPRLYAAIGQHPRAREIYAQKLESEGLITPDDAESIDREVHDRLRAARDGSPDVGPARDATETDSRPVSPTAQVSASTLHAINQALLERPEGFTANPKLERILGRRREAIDDEHTIDWAFAEILALGSILADGTPIRFTGQDSERGTFSQRHLVLHDPETGTVYSPLQSLPQAKASFAMYNSPLTEMAVLAFEYGYSVHAPDALVLWEAQYGDFANVGQVIIDQFITAARAKWGAQPGLVLLLPHGYEGAGPEHSSARLERFLQLAAGRNVRVVYPTCAAQYFHLLRSQAAMLRGERMPLVVMTPKSLLRRPEAASSLSDLTAGSFSPVIDDAAAADRVDRIERLVLSTGKVSVDAALARQKMPVEWIALARVEQLYPFPDAEVKRVVSDYPNLREVVWLQEEPMNMGAWGFVAPRLRENLPAKVSLRYVGRPERPSTATGSPDFHSAEQAHIVGEALGDKQAPEVDSRESHDGG